MQTQLSNILQEAKEQLKNAVTEADAEELRIKLLGKKGRLTEILRSMGSLDPQERKTMGQAANSVRSEIESLLEETFARIRELQKNNIFVHV